MKIEIRSAEQFNNLLDALAGDIIDGELYFKLYKDLNQNIENYHREFNQSRTFWGITRKALVDSTLLRLCRIYDTNTKSLSLFNLLDTIKANLEIFDVDSFRERLRDNPFVDSLSETARKPDIEELNQHISEINTRNPLVKKFIIWRHNILAHKTATNVVNNIDVTEEYNITYNDISELLARATNILNKYSGLFRASSYSTQAVGYDDYLNILNAIRYRLDSR